MHKTNLQQEYIAGDFCQASFAEVAQHQDFASLIATDQLLREWCYKLGSISVCHNAWCLLYPILKVTLEEIEDNFLHHVSHFVTFQAGSNEHDWSRIRDNIVWVDKWLTSSEESLFLLTDVFISVRARKPVERKNKRRDQYPALRGFFFPLPARICSNLAAEGTNPNSQPSRTNLPIHQSVEYFSFIWI